MTGWDILDKFINGAPSIAATVLLVAAAVIFVVGFSRYGFNFLKYGFSQKEVDDLCKKIDGLSAEVKTEIGNLRTEFHTELETIKINHFGHLKNFLCELTSILLDKNVINNTDKARLDNQLRDM